MRIARGSIVALVTPFDKRGRVDFQCLEELVSWHIEQGTDALVCCGTTGEGMTLSEREKKQVVAACVAAANHKIPMIACSGSADTRRSVCLTEQMLRLGAEGCLIITPYYNKPTQKGCIGHFAEVAKVGLPVIIYNNPGRTVVKLLPETIAEIAQFPGIVAIKESGGSLEDVAKIRKLTSLPILSGDDDLTHQTLALGGFGAISVVGNILPNLWKKMIAFALEGNLDASKVIADECAPLCKALFLETNPQCVKFAMSQIGKCRSVLRLPLIPPTQTTQERIKAALLDLFRKV